MKKINLVITFLVIMMSMFVAEVKATGACTYSVKSALNKSAWNMTFDYVPVEKAISGEDYIIDEEMPLLEYSFDLGIYNLTSDFYIILSNDKNAQTEKIYSTSVVEGKVIYNVLYTDEVVTYKFEIFANEQSCRGTLIRTAYVAVPIRNEFATMNVCDDIPDFYLCQKYVTRKTDYPTFLRKANDYKNKIVVEKEEETEKPSSVFNVLNKYKYFIITGVVVISGVTTFIVVKKKRSRIV